MTASPPTVAFHIGAHKTATTHLQLSLRRAAEAMGAAGVRYYGPERFRLPGHSLQALFGTHPDGETRTRRSAEEQLALLAKGAGRLVLSEENFIGPLFHPGGGAMKMRYRPAADRLSDLAAAMGRPIDLFLGVRRPTGYLNAAYCQMLMGGKVMDLDTFQRRNRVESVDWHDLVLRLRAAPGVGQITLWRQEDYGTLFPRIVAGLAGEAAPHVTPVARYVHRSLSAPMVAEILHRGLPMSDMPASQNLRRMLSVEAGYPPFDGYDTATHAAGDAAYAAQIAAIAQMDGVTLLRP